MSKSCWLSIDIDGLGGLIITLIVGGKLLSFSFVGVVSDETVKQHTGLNKSDVLPSGESLDLPTSVVFCPDGPNLYLTLLFCWKLIKSFNYN